jgi:hypothetical protein
MSAVALRHWWLRLALAPKELEHDNAGDPSDRQARQSEESDEEEFECEKHAFILILRHEL